MHISPLLASLALVRLSVAGYAIQQDYAAESFFSMFEFFNDTDPTNGFVDYVNSDVATSSELIKVENGKVYMGVDYESTSPQGRSSVRIASTATYNEGLVILDLDHFPGGICGTWPAFWMLGSGEWPSGGEIDILEGVNSQVANQMTLHTGQGCSIAHSGAMAGNIELTDCYAHATEDNQGCAIKDTAADTFSALNENGGGVFATEIDPTNNKIQVWFFDRSSVPSDITNGNPDPTSWGNPRARFQGGCEVSSHFKDLNIVFDTTFCGDWAGNAWSSDATCSAKASTCEDFVQNNPAAFKDAYWSINSLKVYSSDGVSGSSSSTGAGYNTPTPLTPLTPTIGQTTPVATPIPTPSTPGLSVVGQPMTPGIRSSANSVRPVTTIYVTVTPAANPTPAATPDNVVARAAVSSSSRNAQEIDTANRIAHARVHRKRTRGWRGQANKHA